MLQSTPSPLAGSFESRISLSKKVFKKKFQGKRKKTSGDLDAPNFQIAKG